MTPQPFRPACLLPFVLLLLRARGEISGQAIASAVRRLWSPNVSGGSCRGVSSETISSTPPSRSFNIRINEMIFQTNCALLLASIRGG